MFPRFSLAAIEEHTARRVSAGVVCRVRCPRNFSAARQGHTAALDMAVHPGFVAWAISPLALPGRESGVIDQAQIGVIYQILTGD